LAPINIIQTVLTGVVYGVVYFGSSYTEECAMNLYTYFTSVMIAWIFITMSKSVHTFLPERRVINKERASASYRLSAYFVANTVADLPVVLLMPFIFMVISYWMTAPSLGFLDFVLVTCIAMLAVMTGQSLGYLLGAIFDDIQVAGTVSIVANMLLLLTGNSALFNPNIASWVDWVKYLSPFYYAGNAAMQVVFQNDIPCDGSGLLCKPNETSYPFQLFLQDFIGVTLPFAINLTILFLFILVPRLVAYIALRRKKPQERE